jgi:hypothetical protein
MKQLFVFEKALLCLALVLVLGTSFRVYAQSMDGPLYSHGALDIGPIGHTGAYIQTGDTYRIWGSGSDIGGTSDQFHYVWYDLSADGEMVAQVLSQDVSNGRAKAGIMLRETLASGAANVFLAITPQHGILFQWRGAANALTHSQQGPQRTVPTWLKLLRHLNTIKGFASTNGITWTLVSSVTLPMTATSSIGLAVTAHNNATRSRAVFAHVALTYGTAPAALTATRVYGQSGSFSTKTNNNGGISANSLSYPWGAAIDSSGGLYIADDGNNRVLYYPSGSTTATRVYGQAGSFSTNIANNGGVSATSLDGLEEIVLDSGGGLYVADAVNNRVLYYPSGSTTATRIYGQNGSFSTNTINNGGVSANSLNSPWGMKLDSSGGLYIAYSNNNRVLYYPSGSTTATRFYGQNGSFSTNTANNGGVSATSLNDPLAIELDNSNNLYVEDDSNNRILYYPAGSTTATRVYGQNGSFSTTAANNGGISASSLSDPEGMMILDGNDNLYVADSGNNRVLMFPSTW